MKKTFWGPLIIITLAIQLSACSSSEKKEDPAVGDVPPVAANAGTDAVPAPVVPEPAVEGGQAAGTDAAALKTAAPITPAPNVEGGGRTSYTVQTGDTLMKIAFETYGDVYKWTSILDGNRDQISDPKALKEGMILKLDSSTPTVAIDRNGEKYFIKKGDTLGTISGEVYGSPTKWKRIWENNKQLIHDPNKIYAGFYLYYLSNGSGANLAVTQPPVQAQAAGQIAPQAAAIPAATDLSSSVAAIQPTETPPPAAVPAATPPPSAAPDGPSSTGVPE